MTQKVHGRKHWIDNYICTDCTDDGTTCDWRKEETHTVFWWENSHLKYQGDMGRCY